MSVKTAVNIEGKPHRWKVRESWVMTNCAVVILQKRVGGEHLHFWWKVWSEEEWLTKREPLAEQIAARKRAIVRNYRERHKMRDQWKDYTKGVH